VGTAPAQYEQEAQGRPGDVLEGRPLVDAIRRLRVVLCDNRTSISALDLA